MRPVALVARHPACSERASFSAFATSPCSAELNANPDMICSCRALPGLTQIGHVHALRLSPPVSSLCAAAAAVRM